MATLAEFQYRSTGNGEEFSQEFGQMLVLQGYKLGMFMDDLCHGILGHEVLPKGTKRDLRSYQIPGGVPELLKALRRMFEVDIDAACRAFYPSRFVDPMWRQTSYAELGQIRSSGALNRDGISRALEKLESCGVVERRTEWVPHKSKTLLFIKFNAGRVLDLIRESINKKSNAKAIKQGKTDKASNVPPISINADILNNKAVAESPVAGVPIAGSPSGKEQANPISSDCNSNSLTEAMQSVSDNPVVSREDQEAKQFEKQEQLLLSSADPVVARIWTIMLDGLIVKPDFDSPQQRLACLKALRRRVEHPFPHARLTYEDWEMYEKHIAENSQACLWCCDLDVVFFLNAWTKIKCVLLSIKHQSKGSNGFCMLRELGRIEKTARRDADAESQHFSLWAECQQMVDPTYNIVDDLIFKFKGDAYSILTVAHTLAIDMSSRMPELRKAFRQWCADGPEYFMELHQKRLFPVRQWAGFNHLEMLRMIASANVSKIKSAVRCGISAAFSCSEVEYPPRVLRDI